MRKPLSERVGNRQTTPATRYDSFYSQYDPLQMRSKRAIRVPKDRSWVVTFSIGMAFLEIELYIGLSDGARWPLVACAVVYFITVFTVLVSDPYNTIKGD